MAEGIRDTDILREEPRDGEPCGCGEPAELVCYTPVHNGVYAYALRQAFCQPCGYLLAEHIGEYFQKEHEAQAPKDPPSGQTTLPLGGEEDGS